MVNFLRAAVIVILFLQVNLVFAQKTIRIQSGGTVNFNINSFRKYEQGMELNNWTVLSINFMDTVVTTARWKLEFKARTDSIMGDYMGHNNLDLDLISLQVESVGGTSLNTFIQNAGSYRLTYTEQAIIFNAPQGGFDQNKLRISYSVGTGTEKLLNNPANYYFVDIEFILSRAD